MTANEVASANVLKTKRQRISTPNYCGFIDQEKGQVNNIFLNYFLLIIF